MLLRALEIHDGQLWDGCGEVRSSARMLGVTHATRENTAAAAEAAATGPLPLKTIGMRRTLGERWPACPSWRCESVSKWVDTRRVS